MEEKEGVGVGAYCVGYDGGWRVNGVDEEEVWSEGGARSG